MIVGVDASNIRAGGGVTHLVELMRAADPVEHGFSRVILWSGHATLSRMEDRPWLVKSHQRLLDRSLAFRVLWQRFRLSAQARSAKCDILFVPGGSIACDFRPMVIMSQNLLPFEWHELLRFGWSAKTLKQSILRWTQSFSFRRADGLIFLTRYARDGVMRVIETAAAKTAIIPHGINRRFCSPPREQLAIDRYTVDRPFRILYVSMIDAYKHQWHVAEAVAQLRRNGTPATLDLIGPAYPPALRRLRRTLDRIDPGGGFVRYSGEVPHSELHLRYAQADMFLFASSCETFGQILAEAMSAGLPIACSNRSALPEVLGDAGVYFDPENPRDIARALRELIDSPGLRAEKAKVAFERAKAYSWARCSRDTFRFLAGIAGAPCSGNEISDENRYEPIGSRIRNLGGKLPIP